MITLRRLIPLAAVVAVALGPTTASAQDVAPASSWGQERGLSVGLKFLLDSVGADEGENPPGPVMDDIGAGLALCGGYTFTPHFHMRLTVGVANHGTNFPGLALQHSVGTIEAHYRFLPDRQVCPYVLGAFGGTDSRADHGADHMKYSGAAAGIGAGVLVGFTRQFLLDITGRLDGVNWTKAEWSHDQPDGSVLKYEDAIEGSGGSLRLELGLLWQF